MAEYTIPFKCGSDGTEWVARLEPVGARLGFTSFSRAAVKVEPLPADRRAQVMQRFNDLLNTKAPLPPPQSVELIQEEVQRQLTSAQVTSFGFSCPSCRNTQPLLCLLCQKYSCQGATRDSAGRFQCQWCGETLVLSSTSPAEGTRDVPIDASTMDLKLRARELPARTDRLQQEN